MKAIVQLLVIMPLMAAGACRESMHPEPASEPTDNAPQAESAKPQAQPSSTEKAPEAPKEVSSDGYQVVRAKTEGDKAAVDIKAPAGWKVVEPPNSPDPHAGKFTLAEAVKGLPAKGALTATITTSLGTLRCNLFDDKAPNTVANFIGLARGLRKFWSGPDHAWVGRPYYDGTTFHRIIPGFMIQGGDIAGDGSGGVFYTIPDEIHPSLKHDHAGQLCMANRGPNTNEAQFFITDAAAPHLDGGYTIFGQCTPEETVYRIARVPQGANNRPITPVVIEKVTIARGGRAATPTASNAPLPKNTVPGVVPPGRAVRADDSSKPAQ